jgi:NADH-quinone oxidoreductase subunit C
MSELLDALKTTLNNVKEITEHCAQLTLTIEPEFLLPTMLALRDHSLFKFEQMIDLCAVDYLSYGLEEWTTTQATSQGFSRGVTHDYKNLQLKTPARFAVVYHLLSISLNHRLRVKVFVNNPELMIPSVIDIWECANWYEREAFDLYGILFENHPDLRRILTDYGFCGHPFRKDFPLSGEVEVRYDATEGRVIYEPVSIEPRILVPKTIRKAGEEHV